MNITTNTPVLPYKLQDREIFVKRDDLMGDGITLPPWGKLEAIKMLFQLTSPLGFPYIDPSWPVSYLCLRSSWSGWALGSIGTELGFDVRIGYPNSKNFPKEMLEKIESTGATLVPLKPNMLSVCLGMLKKVAKEKNWQMFPYAFENPEYLKYFKNRSKNVEGDYDTLVTIGGTPCTSIGLCQGFRGSKIHLVLTCSLETAKKQLKKYRLDNDERIELHTTPYDFYDTMDFLEAPFPMNRYWEAKGWWWMQENLKVLDGKVLFWNLGA